MTQVLVQAHSCTKHTHTTTHTRTCKYYFTCHGVLMTCAMVKLWHDLNFGRWIAVTTYLTCCPSFYRHPCILISFQGCVNLFFMTVSLPIYRSYAIMIFLSKCQDGTRQIGNHDHLPCTILVSYYSSLLQSSSFTFSKLICWT